MSSILIRKNRDFYIKARKAVQFFTDLFGIPAAGYSLRKLSPDSVYSGPAIRVRRSSDNAEMDIGFANNVLDTAALLSFVGSGNGFVTTWYDQSGLGLNVAQTAAGSQPRIVNGGVVETENGEPAVRFTGSVWLTGGNILSVGTSNDMMTFSVARTLDTQNRDVFFKGFTPAIVPSDYSLTFTGGTTTSFVRNDANNDVRASVSNILTNQILYTTEFIRNTSNRLFRNGSQVAQNTTNIGVIGTNDRSFAVGALLSNDTTGFRFMNGTIQEIIIYHKPTLPNRNNIETNINNYYNVY